MRRYEPLGKSGRRQFLSSARDAGWRGAAGRAGARPAHAAHGVPAAAQPEGDGAGQRPRDPGDRRATNVSHAVYEYASGGSEDDATLLGKSRGVSPDGAATARHGRRQQDRHVARGARAEAGVPDHAGAREQEPRRAARRQGGGDRRARRQGDLRHRRQRARVHRRPHQGRPGAVVDGEHARARDARRRRATGRGGTRKPAPRGSA